MVKGVVLTIYKLDVVASRSCSVASLPCVRLKA